LAASTPGLNHPRHQQKRTSKSSILSSAAPWLVSSKPLNEFAANDTISTSSVAKSAPTEEQLFGEFLDVTEMLQASELSSTSNADSPTFIKLAPYFESIPNRKYTSLSRLRQMRCVNLAGDPITRSRRRVENLYQNGILGQPFSEAQEARAELVVSICFPLAV
uniref:SAP30_Sin3_bdg domain-containing protein n=1 Tax=Taenia asiatica TaxID=60517 RepID=A0A0R3VVJ8_TAEAS